MEGLVRGGLLWSGGHPVRVKGARGGLCHAWVSRLDPGIWSGSGRQVGLGARGDLLHAWRALWRWMEGSWGDTHSAMVGICSAVSLPYGALHPCHGYDDACRASPAAFAALLPRISL